MKVGVVGGQFLGGAALQDVAGEAAQALGGLRDIAASAVIDDADAGALLDGIPDVLGELEVAQDGTVGTFLLGLAQVHVSHFTDTFCEIPVP